jgi:hypothetical protein
MRVAASLLTAIACTLTSFSCGDPVRDQRIQALGGETPGVRHGPLHRPGQPCTLCHSESGTNSPEFSLAGTVYRTPTTLEPLQNATIRFIDSTGRQHAAVSNSAGNFYVSISEWVPNWPVWSKVECSNAAARESGSATPTTEMTSAIFRESSCSFCHADPAGPSSVGHLYFADDDSGLQKGACN